MGNIVPPPEDDGYEKIISRLVPHQGEGLTGTKQKSSEKYLPLG